MENRGYAPRAYHSTQKVCKAYLADRPLHTGSWSDTLHAYRCRKIDDPHLVNSFDPQVLAAKDSKYNVDSPNWDMVMGGPFKAEYWSVIKTEQTMLYSDLKAWEYVRSTPNMRVCSFTWAFK